MFRNIEFFKSPECQIHYRQTGEIKCLLPSSIELVDYVFYYLEEYYPGAFERLGEMFVKSKLNLMMYKFRIVDRFLRCNLSEFDTSTIDIDEDGHLNIERVNCHLRGVCLDEYVICHPKMKLNIRKSEMAVYGQLRFGLSYDEISSILKISPITVKHHCEALRKQLKLSTNEKLIAFWYQRKLEDTCHNK